MRIVTTFFRRRWRLAIVVAAALAAAGGAVAVISTLHAPAASGVVVTECLRDGEDDAACLVFPTVTGSNLLGEAFTLPLGFAGGYNLVLLSFEEDQTVRAQTWLPFVQQLASQHAGLRYYNVPMLKAVAPMMRTFIMTGMLALIPDEELRAITIMLFLEDKQAFLDALDIGNLDAIEALLLNDAGEVLWRGRGEYDPAAGESLAQAVARAAASSAQDR